MEWLQDIFSNYGTIIADIGQFVLIFVLWVTRGKIKRGTATVEDLTALRDYHAKMADKLTKELEGLQK